MRKSRFTEAQIIGMIKEQEAGMPTAEVCRRHGLSPATFYRLKSKYGGMEVSEAARLKALEDENAKLKRLLADTKRWSCYFDQFPARLSYSMGFISGGGFQVLVSAIICLARRQQPVG